MMCVLLNTVLALMDQLTPYYRMLTKLFARFLRPVCMTQVTSMLLGQPAGQLFISKMNKLKCHFNFFLFIFWARLSLVRSIKLRVNLLDQLTYNRFYQVNIDLK